MNRKFKLDDWAVFLFIVGWSTFCLAAVTVPIYIAFHFILKFW